MNTLLPTDIRIIMGIPPVATSSDKVAIDSEWFHMDGKRLHRPHGDFACATFSFDGNTVYVVTDSRDLPQAFVNVEPAVHIYHHAKFDIGQFRRFVEYPVRDRMWDTMLVEQIMYSGYYAEDEYALKDCARRHLHIYMSKSERANFEDADVMTQEMLDYSALDCAITWRVFDSQRQKIDQNDLLVWKKIECRFTFVLLDMGGMPLDKESWLQVAAEHRALMDAIQDKYGVKELHIGPRGGKKEVWNGINLGSTDQVRDQIRKLGYDVPSSNEDDIKHLVDECIFIKDVLEFREHQKAATTYGESMTEFIESDGRMYPDVRQMGAATGRPSMRKPNMQNPPKDKPHRNCFIASPGHVIVDGDWSAQEPRIHAYLCQDPLMLDIFKQKKDIYIEFARLGFHMEITKKDAIRNDQMKPTVLGKAYGLTPRGMVQQYGMTLEKAEELDRKYWEVFKKAKTYDEEIVTLGRKRGYVQTIYGRKYWLNPYQWGWQNNCRNSPVQGSAADAIKIACVKFADEWGWPKGGLTDANGFRYTTLPIINIVHDEIILDVPPEMADMAVQVLRKVMIEAAENMHKGIPADVEINVGPSWGAAH